MIERLDLGSVPLEEPCAQVGEEGYEAQARLECRVYLNQLERVWQQHSNEPLPCGLRVIANPHDFGRYYSVEAWWDEQEPADREDSAFWLEGHLPSRWDAGARKSLHIDEVEEHDHP